MEWPKLKNIVLIILAVTNLCLLIFVAHREFQDSYLRGRAWEDAIRFLADRGVTVAEDQVPGHTVLTPKRVMRDLEQEGTLAAQLLGGRVQAENSGAEVYRYFNEKGSIQFHSDGTFSAEFTPGALPIGEDLEGDCKALLSKMDFVGELTERDGGQLTFLQLWEGVPLFSQQVTVEVEDGCAIAMTGGRRLVGEPEEDPTRRTVTAATGLIELFNGVSRLGDVCSRVDAITPGYAVGTALSGPMTMTPVWHIATDTGTYLLDMVTGTLSRLP